MQVHEVILGLRSQKRDFEVVLEVGQKVNLFRK